MQRKLKIPRGTANQQYSSRKRRRVVAEDTDNDKSPIGEKDAHASGLPEVINLILENFAKPIGDLVESSIQKSDCFQQLIKKVI